MKLCLACDARFDGEGWTCPSCGRVPERRDGFPAFAPELAAGGEGFPVHEAEELARIEESSFWFQARNRLLLWAVRRWFPDAMRTLDVGCGNGFVLAALARELPHARLAGSEIWSGGLRLAATRVANAELMQMDARRIPFHEEFDLVTACDVIEHIDDDAGVLRGIHRAVRPGGGILLTVPQHRWLWSYVDDYSHHKRRYSRRELIAKVREAGFEVKSCFSFVSLLVPAMLLSRMLRRNEQTYDPRTEHESAQKMSGLLGSIMTIERALITRGVRFPVGGSLLLVAYKPGRTRI